MIGKMIDTDIKTVIFKEQQLSKNMTGLSTTGHPFSGNDFQP